jgi:hypothetical protein
LGPEAAAETIADMKRAAGLVADEPRKASPILRFITATQDRATRRAAGLPVATAQSWEDMIRWRDPEGLAAFAASLERELAAPEPRPEAAIERGGVAMAMQDWATAETWFARAREHETGSVSDVTTIDPVFFRALEDMTDEQIAAPFAPVAEVIPRTTPVPRVIYLASDPRYFELFTLPYLESLQEWQADAAVHVHIMDGTADDWRRLAEPLAKFGRLRPTMTAEASAARQKYGDRAGDYYHAVRFIRFYQFLARSLAPGWMTDVDFKIGADPNPILRLLDSYEIVVQSFPTGVMPWHRFGGDVVGVAPTAAGLGYAKLVAAYISHWHAQRGLRWFIDQLALFASYLHLLRTDREPKTFFAADINRDDREPEPSVFRSFSGRRKFGQVASE